MKSELAHPDDETQVKQLLDECELPFEDITPSLLRHFWVLRDGSRLAGVCGLELLGTSALLRSLAVSPRYRGKGIARQLTKQVEQYAHSQGVEALYLLTTTAKDFFSTRGFQTINRDAAPAVLQETTEFQSLCPSTATCMAKHRNAGLPDYAPDT